jgi:hypothetical protein
MSGTSQSSSGSAKGHTLIAVFDGEVRRACCAFVEGVVGSQSIAGAAEQVDFDGEGEGVAVADGSGREVRT